MRKYWNDQKITITEQHRIEANAYMEKGYRRISNKYCHISRVDREDWKELVAKRFCSWDIKKGLELVERRKPCSGFYRSVLSEDILTVAPEIMALIDPSTHDPVEFINIEE
jgi:hypothetical protein